MLQTVRDKCFEKCVTKPSSSLGSSEQQCLARCCDRYAEVSGQQRSPDISHHESQLTVTQLPLRSVYAHRQHRWSCALCWSSLDLETRSHLKSASNASFKA